VVEDTEVLQVCGANDLPLARVYRDAHNVSRLPFIDLHQQALHHYLALPSKGIYF